MAKEESKKWEGESTVKLSGVSPHQIWPLISDFCSINKWLPHVETCYLLEGVVGQPGMTRYCASSTTELPGCGPTQLWATERLLFIDQSHMCFSYEIVDNNAGFKSYVATVRLCPLDDDGDDGFDGGDHVHGGCKIAWSFVADPVDGWTQEGFVGFLESAAQAMAKRMEEALLQPMAS